MNVYLWANEIDPQTLGSLNLEGIYRWGDEVWTNGDKYELITSNGNYWTIWHNLTEWTFVISRHPASHWAPNTWSNPNAYPGIVIADHDYWVDPTLDEELWTYTDWDWNTVKQILAWAENIISSYTPWDASPVNWYHVPTIEEFRELIRLVAPILWWSYVDPDYMNIYKVLRFSMESRYRTDVKTNYQINQCWWRQNSLHYYLDSYTGGAWTSAMTIEWNSSNFSFSWYIDDGFDHTFRWTYSSNNYRIRLFRNIESTVFAPGIQYIWYCSHTPLSYGDIVYSWIDSTDVWTSVSALWTNNFYIEGWLLSLWSEINICAKVSWNSYFPRYYSFAILERTDSANNWMQRSYLYWTDRISNIELAFQINYPDNMALSIWDSSLNLSFSWWSDTSCANPYIYITLTSSVIKLLMTDWPIPASGTRTIFETEINPGSGYIEKFNTLMNKKFIQIRGIETVSYSWSSISTAVNVWMPMSSFRYNVFNWWESPWDDWIWAANKSYAAEIL